MTHEQKAASYYEEWDKKPLIKVMDATIVEFATYVLEREEKDKIEPLLFNTDWTQVNTTLLVNFLRLPENHQKSLIDSMFERRPELFAGQWKAYPEEKPTEIGFYLVIQDGYDGVNFDWWASDMFLDYTDVIAFMPIPKFKKP